MRLPMLPILRRTATATAVLLLAGAGAGAETKPGPATARPELTAPLSLRTTVAPAETAVLKHLPAGQTELVFRGEAASRRFQVQLSRSEADRASAMQLALVNAVAVLPDRSSLKLTINGHAFAALPVHSPDRANIARVKIPAGVLVPGNNIVEISVALAHRVDCSVNATYELWAMLDPAETGIVTDRGSASSARTLDDVAAEPLADDGTTRIHVRMAEDASVDAIGRAGQIVSALVTRAGLVRPVVDAGPNPGAGPGFDLLLTDDISAEDMSRSLKVVGREEGVTLGRDPSTNRLVIAVSGDASTLAGGTPKGKANPVQPGTDIAIDAGSRKTFAELGLANSAFSGRHLTASVGLSLPANFYPANYDKARLLIDGGHAATLDPNGELIFRVNGFIVSTMRLTAGEAERYRQEEIDLPLRFFHPGHNEVSIEGMTTTRADEQCDLLTMPRDARLSIAGTSVLEFPQFARLGTLPQIPAALPAGTAGSLRVYLADASRDTVGAALTVLANMAASTGRPASPSVTVALPENGDEPGLVIAPFDRLPETLATPLRRLSSASIGDKAGLAPTQAASRPAPDALEEAAAANRAQYRSALDGLVSNAKELLRSRGFFFADTDPQTASLPVNDRSLLIGAVPPDHWTPSLGGLELPRFTRDAAQWLVVTGNTEEVYGAGVEHLVANGQWSNLAGQAVSLDLDTQTFKSAQPVTQSYVVPSDLVLLDVRPIMGGIVSNHIMLSLLALTMLLTILGLSTHALIRRSGAK